MEFNILQDGLNELKTHVITAERELMLLSKGKKASAPRTRKSLQNIKKTAHLLRANTTKYVKQLPVQKKEKKEEKNEEKKEE